jgi:beta-glucanase (GH16 family)
MKKYIRLALIFMILAGSLSFIPIKSLAAPMSCRWQLTFGDNFDDPILDILKWNTQYPSGNSGEKQYYAPEAISLQDGILKITAEDHQMNGYPYTSGIITTQERFSQKFGLFTIRAKLPKGQGFWPAFWMLPEQPDYPTEIDIFEMLGKDTNTIYMSNHWKDTGDRHEQHIVSYQGPDFSTKFHTFSLVWSPSELIWFVDGVEQYRTTEGVPATPMFLLVNLAVGGKWPGNPNKTTPFPGSMEVDYLHIYTRTCHTDYIGFAGGVGAPDHGRNQHYH